METWLVVTPIISAAAAIGLLGIVYELDAKTPSLIRWLMVGLAIGFFAAFLISFNKRISYELAIVISFTGLGVMVLAVVTYMILTKQMQSVVVKISGLILGVIILVWLVANCSDSRRQKDQLESKAPTSLTVTIGDSTQKAVSEFNRLSGND